MPDYSDFRLSGNIEDRRDDSNFKNWGGGLLAALTAGVPSLDDAKLMAQNPMTPWRDILAKQPLDPITPLGAALGASDIQAMQPRSGGASLLGQNTSNIYTSLGAVSNITDNIVRAESGGDNNAKNPNSSASGPGQFIDSTFLDVIRKARPDLADKSDSELLALKTDPVIGRQATEAYAAQNGETLAKNGLPVTPGTTYLAHFAGPTGAVSILKADPTASAASILGPAVVKANPFLANMTAADLQAWAAKKIGGSAPQPQAPQASPAGPPNGLLAPSAPSSALLNSIPQQGPPIFAPRPQQPQPQQQSEAGGGFEQTPPMQGAPIFYQPRRSPDLSKLRAAFQAPIFPRG